jgi:hypothetical protein
MRTTVLWLLLLGAGLLPTAAAQTLWDGARAGMSLAEVQGAYPAAQPVDPRFHGRDGAQEYFHLPGVQVAGIGFTARFLFVDERLTGVILQRSDSDKPGPAYVAAAEAIRHALTAQFGAPIASETVDGGFIQRKGKWASAEGVEVWLTFSAWGDDNQTPLMEIGYRVE